ncbi:MAG: hypothetical protein GX061_05375 [Eubacteriaceae bacterium]|nr:hypothetical protein [Eubacteriaceae bacterium]
MKRKANQNILFILSIALMIFLAAAVNSRQSASEKEFELLKYPSHTPKDYSSFSTELSFLTEETDDLEEKTEDFLKLMREYENALASAAEGD